MLYRARMKQANKEARITLIGVGVVIVCWAFFGFGLSQVDITIFSTPLWIVMGCLGTWVVALIVSIILATKVIEDCPLDEDDFGRKYQREDTSPVEVSPMTLDYDILKTIEPKRVNPRKPLNKKPVGNVEKTSRKRRNKESMR